MFGSPMFWRSRRKEAFGRAASDRKIYLYIYLSCSGLSKPIVHLVLPLVVTEKVCVWIEVYLFLTPSFALYLACFSICTISSRACTHTHKHVHKRALTFYISDCLLCSHFGAHPYFRLLLSKQGWGLGNFAELSQLVPSSRHWYLQPRM